MNSSYSSLCCSSGTYFACCSVNVPCKYGVPGMLTPPAVIACELNMSVNDFRFPAPFCISSSTPKLIAASFISSGNYGLYSVKWFNTCGSITDDQISYMFSNCSLLLLVVRLKDTEYLNRKLSGISLYEKP